MITEPQFRDFIKGAQCNFLDIVQSTRFMRDKQGPRFTLCNNPYSANICLYIHRHLHNQEERVSLCLNTVRYNGSKDETTLCLNTEIKRQGARKDLAVSKNRQDQKQRVNERAAVSKHSKAGHKVTQTKNRNQTKQRPQRNRAAKHPTNRTNYS